MTEIEKAAERRYREEQEAAGRRYREEEEQRKQRRIAELAGQERERRRKEEAERTAERRRQEAGERAAELARKRRVLEDRAEEELAAVSRTLDELVGVDREHAEALRVSGRNGMTPTPMKRLLGRWLHVRLRIYIGGPNRVADPHAHEPLAVQDRLTPR